MNYEREMLKQGQNCL